ncbi:MAG TPA: type II toxin-antitoxin system RelB/DinJ family antitoxin, partial [Acholeplasma sp.]|nr:type II toxin-antitoxin system RelB/DinJ family antitoxin [Acholeplasma sp.]
MKKNEYINVRVNEKVKEEAENIFKDLGLKMSDAINIFLNQVCVEKGLP